MFIYYSPISFISSISSIPLIIPGIRLSIYFMHCYPLYSFYLLHSFTRFSVIPPLYALHALHSFLPLPMNPQSSPLHSFSSISHFICFLRLLQFLRFLYFFCLLLLSLFFDSYSPSISSEFFILFITYFKYIL